MTNPGGDFFLEFSIRDTVGKNRYFSAHMQENRMAGVCGISGGGGGFSRGFGSISRGAGEFSAGQGGGVGALRSRQESMGFNIVEAGGKEFDQAEFIDSLREDVEVEIKGQDLQITTTDTDTFGSAGFSIDYAEPGIEGRVHILGRRSLDNRYHITAIIEEKRTQGSPEPWPKIPWFYRDRSHPPQGNYHVVAFSDDDIRAHSRRFYYRGQEALDSSRARLRRLRTKDPSNSNSLVRNLAHAEVYMCEALPAEIKEKLGGNGRLPDIPPEYDRYAIVYFLNDAAVAMYREAGEEFEILKTICEEEMSRIRGPQLGGPYLPKEP